MFNRQFSFKSKFHEYSPGVEGVSRRYCVSKRKTQKTRISYDAIGLYAISLAHIICTRSFSTDIMYEGSYTLLSNRLEGAFLRALHYIDVVLAALLI